MRRSPGKEVRMASSQMSFGLKIAALLWALPFAATPASAGLDKGSVTVDSAVVFLGVVPATQTRDYSSERVGDMVMGGRAASNVNNIHLVVALFDHGSGKRITDAQVRARFIGERGRRWSAALEPMTMNGAMSYGAYASMGGDNRASILIDVERPFGRSSKNLTARFEYSR
jgi:hypothetical protein